MRDKATSRYKAFERIFFGKTEDEDKHVESVNGRIPYAFGWNRKLNEPSRQKFSSTDSEDAWESNLKNHKDLLEKYGWLDTEVYYDLNSHGYRDEEFKESPNSIVAAGECFTYATGLPIEMSWPYLLGKELDTKIWNLALCTTGLDVTFRSLLSWLPVIKPKMVLLLENSQLGREVWYIDEEKDEWNTQIGFWSDYDWQKELVESKTERFISRQKNLLAIKQLCQIHDIELKIVSARERNEIGLSNWNEHKEERYALSRDLMHPGLAFHEAIAERWKKEL